MSEPGTRRERPRTSKAWPRLSQTLPHLHPLKCAACGAHDMGSRQDSMHSSGTLTLWQEHDENDQPEARYILLCLRCGDQLIEPHVRLYGSLDRNTPAPGAMEICADCRFRDGTWCARAKCNGGEGVVITAVQPTTAFVDGMRGGRRTGWRMLIYPKPPSACSGREEGR